MSAKYVVRLLGGLGNQMHCYAFGMALAKHQNVEVNYDCETGYISDVFGRCYMLDWFPDIKINKMRVPSNKNMIALHKIYYIMASKIGYGLPLRMRPVVREPIPQRYFKEILDEPYIISPYFIGNWGSYKYCEGIEEKLRSELAPPIPDNYEVLKWLKKIRNVRSCFIHYRSYCEDQNYSHPSMSMYYRDAISFMKYKMPDIRFFVFSDNHALAKAELSNIGVDYECVDLSDCVGNINSLNDFYLMYACTHSIIGDSTFSWWAAWLSDNEEKIVIAPNGLSPWGDDWVPSKWKKYNC